MSNVDSASSSPRIEELSDNLNFHEIDNIIDDITYGNLSSFCNNDKLISALDKDAYIINNVSTQVGITKACEYGLKLSAIIKNKALQLNESTVLELLDIILSAFTRNFFTHDATEIPADGQSDDELGSDKAYRKKIVDFVSISKHFPSNVLAYSPLSWDTLQLSGLATNAIASHQKIRKTNISSYNPSSYKELTVMDECEEELETKERIDHLSKRIKEVSINGPVNFWEFVLDSNPVDGFNKTCLNLYSMTFLVASGAVLLSKGADNEILLRASGGKENKDTNCQAILSGWSYEYWLKLVEKFPR